jgi:hypothetical protein
MPVLGATSPKESACISAQPAENACRHGPSAKAQSPAASNLSNRSLQSEALSQLSCNPGAITFRKVCSHVPFTSLYPVLFQLNASHTAKVRCSCVLLVYGRPETQRIAFLRTRIRVLVCPEPPLVFSHELLGRLRTGVLMVSPLQNACVFLHWELRPKLKASVVETPSNF